jgi:hypothetical protein
MSIVGTPLSLCLADVGGRPDRPHGFVTPLAAAMLKGWRVLLLALLSVFGVACEDATEPQATTEAPAAATSPSSGTISTHALVRREWIARQDQIAPDQWLASRAAGVDVAATDPSVSAMHALLGAAHERFGDPSRMIANRAVQPEGMLKEKGIVEPAPELIRLLLNAAGTTENMRGFEGFGAMCQKYFILREQGLARDQAIAQLTTKVQSVQ